MSRCRPCFLGRNRHARGLPDHTLSFAGSRRVWSFKRSAWVLLLLAASSLVSAFGEGLCAEQAHAPRVLVQAQTRGEADAGRALEDSPPPFGPEAVSGDVSDASPSPGDLWRDPEFGMDFVWVPGGCFFMGEAQGDALSAREICLDGFWMGKREVTQGEYEFLMQQNPSRFQSFDSLVPVERVTWNDAKKFALQLTTFNHYEYVFDLPTEAQWEYAARMDAAGRVAAGGGNAAANGWGLENSGGRTHACCKSGTSALGLCDMVGNVWEWCEDVYDSDAGSKLSGSNPVCVSGSRQRVIRGGGWASGKAEASPFARWGASPWTGEDDVGFRVIRKGRQK